MKPRDNIPPLTVAWLRKRGACVAGIARFRWHASGGELVMNSEAADVLARNQAFGDLVWLLRQILGLDGEDEVFAEVRSLVRSRGLTTMRPLYAAACVAAWREYHR